MQRFSLTPFGRRPVSPGLLAAQTHATAPAELPSVNKWHVLHDLTTARNTFSVSSRALVVLEALLSFYPDTELTGDSALIVFPSNRTLSDRCRGMAEATLRRHLAALSEAGLILRHDSPNGKRYARRDRAGALVTAYGFDLRPLLTRATEIAEAAEAERDRDHRLSLLREAIVLVQRDCAKLAERIGGLCDSLAERFADLRRGLRRKLSELELTQLLDAATALRDRLAPALPAVETAKPSGCDSQNERHKDLPNPDLLFEETEQPNDLPDLHQVLDACPKVRTYASDLPRNWREMVGAMAQMSTWLGITPHTWREATESMGPETAALAMATILERQSQIRSPGAYLRRLSQNAQAGRLQPNRLLASTYGDHLGGAGAAAIG